MKKTLLLLATLGAAALLVALPADAITDGAPDGNGHPYVGLVVAYDAHGNPFQACSGTLLSETVFVTAGHCTFGASSAQIWFDSGYPSQIPLGAGYGANPVAPCSGVTGFPCTGGAVGRPLTHPDFDPSAFQLHDVGVVVLDEPVQMPAYGALPAPNELDGLKPGEHTTFTTVGYGWQRSFPSTGTSALKDVRLRTRMVAYPHLLTIDNPSLGAQSLVLSNNASTGGICNGDSGGPNFLGDSNVVAGVSSFVKNTTCAGTGGVFRLDLASARSWVESFLGS